MPKRLARFRMPGFVRDDGPGPSDLLHNELSVAFNPGEVSAGVIGLAQR
jgi:hypothetical protein